MRLPLILPVLAATLLSLPLAAQERAMPEPAPTVQSLPEELAPAPAEGGTVRARRLRPTETGMITGWLVGAAVGSVYGSLTYDENCGGVPHDCLISRDVETVLFGLMGGGVGMLLGLGTSYYLDRRDRTRPGPAVGVAPAQDGAMRVGVTLTH